MMVKKIIIDEEITSDDNFTRRSRGHRSHTESDRYPRFQDDNIRKNVKRHTPRIIETRLFTSRDELVAYVNEKGKSDALIDIYKIEDDLYKLVIKK